MRLMSSADSLQFMLPKSFRYGLDRTAAAIGWSLPLLWSGIPCLSTPMEVHIQFNCDTSIA